MKKVFKFIMIAVIFLLSFMMFGKVAAFFGKTHKHQMAKLA